MKIFRVVWKNIIYNFSSSILGVLLSSLGTAIFCLVLLLSSQMDKQLTLNSKQIDLVIGAKGSPLQLILNSIYHVDYPTGNIQWEKARQVANSPLVKLAVPLSMGDNYQGFRIIGTDSNFLSLYNTHVASGKWVSKDFESVVGYQVAKDKKLKLGDKIVGAHGLSNSEDQHADHPYTVVGILAGTSTVADRLVLTNLSSVWHMHDHEESHHHDGHESHQGDAEEHEHGGEVKEKTRYEESTVHSLLDLGNRGREITSMLIQYKNPTAVAMFPRMVNQTTNMQAASPAIESARLFSIMGIGLDALRILAIVLMAMATISIFISLYNAFKSRKYELAIMRTMGAARIILFKMMIMEGAFITFFGSILGIFSAHVIVSFISFTDNGEIIAPWHFGQNEVVVFAAGIFIGFIAAVIPAIKAYFAPISETLSK